MRKISIGIDEKGFYTYFKFKLCKSFVMNAKHKHRNANPLTCSLCRPLSLTTEGLKSQN